MENSEEMGIPDHLTCLLRNLYAGQEATVRTGHGTTDWFQIGKGVRQGYILSPCLFNLYAEHLLRNAGLEEAQAGIKIAGRNINNLRYADDTTLMTESEEELKSLQVGSVVKKKKKKILLQSRRLGFNPWGGKIPCRRKWQSTPVFLPEKSQGQRSLLKSFSYLLS